MVCPNVQNCHFIRICVRTSSEMCLSSRNVAFNKRHQINFCKLLRAFEWHSANSTSTSASEQYKPTDCLVLTCTPNHSNRMAVLSVYGPPGLQSKVAADAGVEWRFVRNCFRPHSMIGCLLHTTVKIQIDNKYQIIFQFFFFCGWYVLQFELLASCFIQIHALILLLNVNELIQRHVCLLMAARIRILIDEKRHSEKHISSSA